MLGVCPSFDAEATLWPGAAAAKQHVKKLRYHNKIRASDVYLRTRGEITLQLLLLQQPSGINYKQYADVQRQIFGDTVERECVYPGKFKSRASTGSSLVSEVHSRLHMKSSGILKLLPNYLSGLI